MNRHLGLCVLALTAAACRAPQRPSPPSPAPNPTPLAADAVHDEDTCRAREALDAACLYGSAIALGLEARAHPTRAAELLHSMLDRLSAAEAADAGYDHAGPARVRALVLIRAPGWPLGPGDPDAGLGAARQAVALAPDYPPNHLALAEALAKTEDHNGARQSYQRARALALAMPFGSDRDAWLREADQGLRQN